VGAGLPAKNDDAQCLKNRGVFFAGKPAPTQARSYRFCALGHQAYTFNAFSRSIIFSTNNNPNSIRL
jgi:hypothetical protein